MCQLFVTFVIGCLVWIFDTGNSCPVPSYSAVVSATLVSGLNLLVHFFFFYNESENYQLTSCVLLCFLFLFFTSSNLLFCIRQMRKMFSHFTHSSLYPSSCFFSLIFFHGSYINNSQFPTE